MSTSCVSCNEAPPPCHCTPSQTCVQTPRNCTSCPQNICISNSNSNSNSDRSDPHSASAGLGGIIGGAVGATTAAILTILSLWILYKRNYLPPCFYTRSRHKPTTKKTLNLQNFHPTTTSSNPNQKSIFSNPSNHKSSLPPNSSNPHHQSVIYLPTDDLRDPKSSSIESDDDPFSDIHSGVSIISPRPPVSPYSTDDRDGLSKTSLQLTTPDHTGPINIPPSGMPSPSSTIVIASNTNQRASILLSNPNGLPVPPAPTGNPSNSTFKPARPIRAPGLDLRLPGAAKNTNLDPESNKPHFSSTDNLTIPTTPSYPQNNLGSLNCSIQNTSESEFIHPSSDPNNRFRPLSGTSDDAHSQDSHLSSILDPAMIVTPVTLVRTASGRQAAVQRVALRGQEKARVVRLPPSANPKPHVPSPLSLETEPVTPGSSARDQFPETVQFSQSISLALGSKISWDLDSPFANSQSNASQSIFIDSSAITNNNKTTKNSNNNNKHKNHHHGDDDEGTPENSHLSRARSTAAYSTRSSVGASSVCESFLMDDEEVEFPTVLGRSAAILAHRQNTPTPHSTTALENPVKNPVTHHQIHMKALGRDRAISLSSMIGEEAARNSFSSSPPPLPTAIHLPPSALHPSHTITSGSSQLPEPFKPFAGQKPSTSGNNSHSPTGSVSSRSHSQGGTGGRTGRQQEHTQSTVSTASQQSRFSAVSSIRSGYGSVLEGIPFNIGFNSEAEDLFGQPTQGLGGGPGASSPTGSPSLRASFGPADDDDDDPTARTVLARPASQLPATPTLCFGVPPVPQRPPSPADPAAVAGDALIACAYLDQC